MFQPKPTVTKHGQFNCFEKVLLRVGGQLHVSCPLFCICVCAPHCQEYRGQGTFVRFGDECR